MTMLYDFTLISMAVAVLAIDLYIYLFPTLEIEVFKQELEMQMYNKCLSEKYTRMLETFSE